MKYEEHICANSIPPNKAMRTPQTGFVQISSPALLNERHTAAVSIIPLTQTHTRHTQNMWRLHFEPVQNSMNIFTEIRIPPAIFQWRQDSLFPRSRSFARMLATIFYLTPRLEQMTISLICLGRTIMLCQRNTGSAELGRTREDTNAGSLTV
jgi:hypothetical protein